MQMIRKMELMRNKSLLLKFHLNSEIPTNTSSKNQIDRMRTGNTKISTQPESRGSIMTNGLGSEEA